MPRLAPLVLVLVLALACGGVAGQVRPSGEPVVLSLPLAGRKGVLDLLALRGQPVVIHVTTTWSLAGEADLSALRAARKAHPRAAFVTVALDVDGDKLITPWREASGIEWPVAMAPGGLDAAELGPVGIVPTTIVLSIDGRVAWRQDGGLPRGRLDQVLGILESRSPAP